MQKHIFKKSNISGIVGIELMMDDVHCLTQAILYYFFKYDHALQRIAVAFDSRVHGQEIYQNVAQAIVNSGYQVYFLGICPTPVLEYALHQLPVQAGIMITASASSAEFNGFKVYLHKKKIEEESLQEIYQMYKQALTVPLQPFQEKLFHVRLSNSTLIHFGKSLLIYQNMIFLL